MKHLLLKFKRKKIITHLTLEFSQKVCGKMYKSYQISISEHRFFTFVFPSFKNTRSIVNLVNFFIEIIKNFYLIMIFQCCIKASKINLFMSPQKKHSLLGKCSNLFVHSIEAEVQLVCL